MNEREEGECSSEEEQLFSQEDTLDNEVQTEFPVDDADYFYEDINEKPQKRRKLAKGRGLSKAGKVRAMAHACEIDEISCLETDVNDVEDDVDMIETICQISNETGNHNFLDDGDDEAYEARLEAWRLSCHSEPIDTEDVQFQG